MTDYEKICSYKALYEAHKRARLLKRNKGEVIKFELQLSQNLLKLSNELKSKTYKVGEYRKFMVYDPKEREIQALSYRDRVVQHSICDNVLAPYFARRFIYDNSACQVGKGTHFAMNRFAHFLREHYKTHGQNGYILKCDIHKFFDNIDHNVLKNMLSKCAFDNDFKSLIFGIIDSYQKQQDNQSTHKGLPIGNQTSQFFALFYLNPLDRLIKEKLKVKHYTRYMDDFVLIHPSKEFLINALAQIKLLTENVLLLKLNAKTKITPLKNGVIYLAFKFLLTDSGKVLRLLEHSKKIKAIRTLKKLSALSTDSTMAKQQKQIRINSILAHISYGNTFRVQRFAINH
ncbi:MAG: RNA-directed DNA polymerase [Firmicutes bacterium]|nr:RNA-directed DNA polymerase [Bacillota bacterium]